MANPTSAFGWQMPTSTDLVTDLPADFEVFGQAVDTSLADLKGGTTDQVLAKNSNTNMDFKWVTTGTAFKGAWIYNNANQSIANATGTNITYNSEYYDTDNFHSTVTNTDRLTIPTSGYYIVTASIYWANNSTGLREIGLQKNGVTIREAAHDNINANTQAITNISYFAAADYITLRAYQASGGALNSQSGATQGLQIAFLGA
jgi:hypothetical protein